MWRRPRVEVIVGGGTEMAVFWALALGAQSVRHSISTSSHTCAVPIIPGDPVSDCASLP
jgi:hypothetical protein